MRNLTALKISGHFDGFRLLLLVLGAAFLAVASFPQLNLPWLAWLAPGLILRGAYDSSPRRVFIAGWLAGIVHSLISFYWLLLIPFPWYGVVGWLALSILLSVYLAVWCWICWYFLTCFKPAGDWSEKDRGFDSRWLALTPLHRIIWPLLCAAAWVAMEMAMGRILTHFPFISLGALQFRLLPLIQIASITGVYGVSFLVAWLSISLMGAVTLLRGKKCPPLRPLIQLLPPIFAIGCVLSYGLHQLSAPEIPPARLKIALVQPAIPERAIWNPDEETNRFLKLMDLSRAALTARPDLLVWPEAALPEIIGRNRYTQEAIGNLVRPAGVWMVMGLVDIRPRSGPGNSDKWDAFNSAFLINPNGDLTAIYDKSHLVMFGEYTPWWLRHLPFLARLRRAADLTPGGKSAPFSIKTPPARFSVDVCYEDCFPDEVRGRVDADTDFILNLTNDGWFGGSAVQWQHATDAFFRAVENGVPLVRCTNNGLTCWVDARGRLHDIYFDGSKDIYQSGWKLIDVPLRADHHQTFYNRHGDWFGWGCVAITLLAGLMRILQRRDSK